MMAMALSHDLCPYFFRELPHVVGSQADLKMNIVLISETDALRYFKDRLCVFNVLHVHKYTRPTPLSPLWRMTFIPVFLLPHASEISKRPSVSLSL